MKNLDKILVYSLLLGLAPCGVDASPPKVAPANGEPWAVRMEQEDARLALQRREDHPRRDGQNREDERRKEQWRREDAKRREEQRRHNERQRRDDERRREEQHRQWQEQERREWQEQQRRDYRHPDERKRHDWSHDFYRDANWRRTYFMYRSPSPFAWHESRPALHDRFLAHGYRLEPVDDRAWHDRFPGLRCYRWHDNGRHLGHFWYHGRHIRVLMLYFDEWDGLVGIGFMYDNVFVFIRDDHEVYHRSDAWLVGLAAILLAH